MPITERSHRNGNSDSADVEPAPLHFHPLLGETTLVQWGSRPEVLRLQPLILTWAAPNMREAWPLPAEIGEQQSAQSVPQVILIGSKCSSPTPQT